MLVEFPDNKDRGRGNPDCGLVLCCVGVECGSNGVVVLHLSTVVF